MLRISRPAILAVAFAVVGILQTSGPVWAQGYPDHPIRLVVPYPAGNAIDSLARILADRLWQGLGQRFVIENRTGAGGNLGTGAVAKAKPDGYTLLISASGPLAVNRSLYKDLPYDSEKDFEPISLFAVVSNVLVVNKKLGVNSVPELIRWAKERPDQLNYGSVGIGSSQHLAAIYFEAVTGTKLHHVPYRVAGQITFDLLRGDLQLSFALMPNIVEQVRAGEVQALAVTTSKRLAGFPDLPTIAETGVTGYEAYGWFGMLAPKGTPKPILEKLHAEMIAAMANPALRKQFIELGAEPVSTSSKDFGQFIATETEKWSKIVEAADIKPE